MGLIDDRFPAPPPTKLPYEAPKLTELPILIDMLAERHRQIEKWGDRTYPNGTGESEARQTWMKIAKNACKRAEREGRLTFADFFEEEAAEVLACTTDEELDTELTQVMAVCYHWRSEIAKRRSVERCSNCGTILAECRKVRGRDGICNGAAP